MSESMNFVGDLSQYLRTVANTVSSTQFIRELVWNSVQAVQRADGGEVKIDHVVVDGYPKLRVWDTGDGMTAAELLTRFATFAAADRTGKNFGVGAKVSLIDVSPFGAVVTSVRDGHAHQMVMTAQAGRYVPKVLNPDATDDTGRYTRPVALTDMHLTPEIEKVRHGTSVVLLGTGVSDCTPLSLAPADGTGADAKRWIALQLGQRFAKFPSNVKVSAQAFGINADGTHESRIVRGCGAEADEIVGRKAGREREVALEGAKGSLSLGKTIPATAYWWVLPHEQIDPKSGRRKGWKPSSYRRVGGEARLVIDDEVYLGSRRFLRDAGGWACPSRVQIHFVPDASVKVAIDPGRTTAIIAGQPAHEVMSQWCDEFAARVPKAILDLTSTTSRRDTSDSYKAIIEDLYGDLQSVFTRSNRGRQRAAATGQFLDTEGGAAGSTPARPRRIREGLRSVATKVRGPRGGQAPHDGATSTNELVVPDERGTVTGHRSKGPEITAPDIRWVNDGPESQNEELTEDKAGFYVPGSHTLVLNARFAMLTTLIDTRARDVASRAGSREAVERYAREQYARQMRSLVTGNLMLCRGDRTKLAARLTDEALSVAACEVREVDNEVRKNLNRNVGRVVAPLVSEEEEGGAAA